MKQTFDVIIEEDGTFSINTDEIAETEHKAAEEFLEMLTNMAGGERKDTPKEHPFWKDKSVLRGGRIVTNGRK
jgi:hypothetical protein